MGSGPGMSALVAGGGVFSSCERRRAVLPTTLVLSGADRFGVTSLGSGFAPSMSCGPGRQAVPTGWVRARARVVWVCGWLGGWLYRRMAPGEWWPVGCSALLWMCAPLAASADDGGKRRTGRDHGLHRGPSQDRSLGRESRSRP